MSKSLPFRLGAELLSSGTRFSTYSQARSVLVRLFDPTSGASSDYELEARGGGFHSRVLPGVGAGALYKFVLDGRELPDPYARFLPHGVHGPAEVVGSSYAWRHGPVSRPLAEQVIYELHIGTFSRYGTYRGAIPHLRELAELGVTTLELMPVGAFAGSRGWGYDGVAPFAPFAPYGRPDDLRAFIDEAHGLGLSVLLDVVYNHLGHSGNYLAAYSPDYFDHATHNPWGECPNYAHPVVRRYLLDNARYWLEEFRFDGLRLDATQAITDPSPRHVLAELAEEVRALEPRRVLIAEDDRNEPRLVTEFGLDAIWVDDFHHQLRATLTGERDGYYAAYSPGTADLARTIERGWLFEGQPFGSDARPRGADAGALGAARFLYYIQNHDQVGNRAFGDRLTDAVSLDEYCAVSLLFLLLPMTPLLFMGQEWAAKTPFLYFTDHEPELGRLVREGRCAEYARFEAFSDPALRETIPDPQAESTFERSRLRWEERDEEPHRRVLALYRDALALRRSDPVLRGAGRQGLRATARGNVLRLDLHYGGSHRAIVVNFSSRCHSLEDVGIPRATPLLSSLSSSESSESRTLPCNLPPCCTLLLSIPAEQA
jgi:maltooligosyltrehalose trehalohydrolase